MAEMIIYKKPFVIAWDESSKLTHSSTASRFKVLEDFPEKFTGGWGEMFQHYKHRYPHATIRNYDAPYHGKESRYSVPKYTKQVFDVVFDNSWANRDYRLKEILDEEG